MVALARRATEGGSWHVQASLSQTSMWYQSLGHDQKVDVAELDVAELGDMAAFRAEMETPDYGRIRYLTPALSMSDTPPRWDLPPVPAGRHEAVWLPR